MHRTDWTPEEMIGFLEQSDKAVGRALLALLARQTSDEVRHQTTKHHNGRGFTAFDAKIMTSMAQWFSRTGYLTERQLGWLRGRTKKGKMRIAKYARQLADVANETAHDKNGEIADGSCEYAVEMQEGMRA